MSLTVTIITLNEEKNIERAINSAKFADEVIVVDSGSKDKTLEIAKNLGAKVFHNDWPGFGAQKNFAHEKASSEWVFNIDADEEISKELQEEIKKIISSKNASEGYFVPRKTFYLGKWIMHGGWYPNYTKRLSQKNKSKWSEPNVHEELIVDGKISCLKSDLFHYTFNSIDDQIKTNVRYAKEGARDLIRKNKCAGIFQIIFKPFGKFIETYILKKGFLDGFAGFVISINAAHSMFLKYVNANLIRKNLEK